MICDKKKRNKLVESNMGLVYACANRFRGRGVEFDDLVQSGCIGLLKAAQGFDETRGFMFSTYAVPAIIGEIKRIFRDGGAVKVGRSDKEKARRLMELRDEMGKEMGREPTISEIAQKAEMPVADASQLLCAMLPVLSLTIDDDSENPSEVDVTVGDTTEEMGDSIALKAAVEMLADRDKKIVEFRYFQGLTQTVTAKKLGMTQVQVSRREKVILQELRKKLG
ncbi:MAG: sigma-70 family RNA polymerase sigma factor [Clostridia bacterium]|nr:sigma-70 family RNA polymerase sigma factor [Clostridia bacterium]